MNIKRFIDNYSMAIVLVALVAVAVVLLVAFPAAKSWAFVMLALVIAILAPVNQQAIQYFQNHEWLGSIERLFIPMLLANFADSYLTEAYPELDCFGTLALLFAIFHLIVAVIVSLWFKLREKQNK